MLTTRQHAMMVLLKTEVMMKIKAEWLVTAIISGCVAIAACIGSNGDTKALQEIKSGKVSMYCHVRDQDFTKIDPSKVMRVGMEDETGVIEYEFNNGFSRQCYTVTNK